MVVEFRATRTHGDGSGSNRIPSLGVRCHPLSSRFGRRGLFAIERRRGGSAASLEVEGYRRSRRGGGAVLDVASGPGLSREP
jgi:hypothetical protein